MSIHRPLVVTALLCLLSMAWSPPAPAKDAACTGITEKCTADKPYDKTIGGTIYSCYDCKQALCKDGGNGGLSGTKTSSVCTEKATTLQWISLDDQASSSDRLAPKPRPRPRPWQRAGGERRPHSGMANPEAAPESPREYRKHTTPVRLPSRPRRENDGDRTDLPFDEADAIFGPRTKARTSGPVNQAPSTVPEPGTLPPPGPVPPGTPIPYPTHPNTDST